MAGGPSSHKSGKKGGKGDVAKSHEVIQMEETHDIKEFLAKVSWSIYPYGSLFNV